MKMCIGCDQTKPVNEFGLHAGSRDGRNTVCVTCRRIRARDAYNAQRERMQARGLAPNKVGWQPRPGGFYGRSLTADERLSYGRDHAADWRRTSPLASRAYHRAWRAKRQRLTSELAVLNGKRWTTAEDAVVMRDDVGLVELAVLLGRSYSAVMNRRKIVRTRVGGAGGQR